MFHKTFFDQQLVLSEINITLLNIDAKLKKKHFDVIIKHFTVKH